ncbi:hypothetical protein [Pelagovum pacificum]|uniref:Uncharacterized protein n=1 Tax=Pelagovum pacificum TaxID=2588711 RepID=A0A5C5GFP9_9RHOB|nr:hypothetical protein [Pelagovum pacificum]QQA43288.1 hypothetical protein I8N54_01575 [Pelagovum pacificum]TNY33575.1 hypothetical protein FHY64_09950 [Pelagovum pacificum]
MAGAMDQRLGVRLASGNADGHNFRFCDGSTDEIDTDSLTAVDEVCPKNIINPFITKEIIFNGNLVPLSPNYEILGHDAVAQFNPEGGVDALVFDLSPEMASAGFPEGSTITIPQSSGALTFTTNPNSELEAVITYTGTTLSAETTELDFSTWISGVEGASVCFEGQQLLSANEPCAPY